MNIDFDIRLNVLREKVKVLLPALRKVSQQKEHIITAIPEDFKNEFYRLVDQVNLSLMEDAENFYGYFIFLMDREIRFDISSPTAVNFHGAKYVLYLNPAIFLTLNLKQMESSIKHEILHVLSLHLIRAKELKERYSILAINIAMDIVVNNYLSYLSPFATTLERVNAAYSLSLKPYAPFEYYVSRLQTAFDLQTEAESAPAEDLPEEAIVITEYDVARTHDIWEESEAIDDDTLKEFTENIIHSARKGELPTYLQGIITSLFGSRGELPWNLYLKRLMGTVESNKKKTITRRNRRQPERLELRGELRSHKANIVVAIDTSASIHEEEYKQAMQEVLAIVKNYSQEFTLLECDDRIQREYKVRSLKDIKDKQNTRGGTRFSPVIEYANHHKVNLLIYFTDGKGESKLSVTPRGNHLLWVISGRGEGLSLKDPYGVVKKLKAVEASDKALDFSEAANGGYSMNYQEKII